MATKLRGKWQIAALELAQSDEWVSLRSLQINGSAPEWQAILRAANTLEKRGLVDYTGWSARVRRYHAPTPKPEPTEEFKERSRKMAKQMGYESKYD